MLDVVIDLDIGVEGLPDLAPVLVIGTLLYNVWRMANIAYSSVTIHNDAFPPPCGDAEHTQTYSKDEDAATDVLLE